MQHKWTKQYFKDKILRNYDKYSIYYKNWYYFFSNLSSYFIKKWKIYEIFRKKYFLDKNTFIKKNNIGVFNKIKEEIIKKEEKNKSDNDFFYINYVNSLFSYKKDFELNKNEIQQIEDNLHYIINEWNLIYSNIVNNNYITINIKDLFSSVYDFWERYKKYCENINCYYDNIINLWYKWLIGNSLNDFIINILEKKWVIEKGINSNVLLKLSKNLKLKILKNNIDILKYLYIEEDKKERLAFKTTRENNFVYNLIKNNIVDWGIYNWAELYKKIDKISIFEQNKKNNFWKMTPPSRYRKERNKQNRAKEKQHIRNIVNKWDIINLDKKTFKNKKDAKYYW